MAARTPSIQVFLGQRYIDKMWHSNI